jgi:hypothetical protein
MIEDERLQRKQIGFCDFKVVKLNPDVRKIRSIYNNPPINSDSTSNFVQIKLVGFGTHFKEPETEFGFLMNGINKFNSIPSFSVVSDTLAFLNFPSPPKGSHGNYVIGYRNKKDGVQNLFTGIYFNTHQFNHSKINYYSWVNNKFIYTHQNSISNIKVSLHQTSYFNPDTLQQLLKASLQLAYHGGAIIPETTLSDSVTFDSTYSPPIQMGSNNATFYFTVNIPHTLPSGIYDLIFKHPQLPELRILYQFTLYRPDISLSEMGVTIPGYDFQIAVIDEKNLIDTNGLQLEFIENNRLFMDSIKFGDGAKFIFGHADSLSPEGKFHLKIIQKNRSEIVVENALYISKNLPLIIKFRPNQNLNAGSQNSDKNILSLKHPNLVNMPMGYLAPIRFLKNGVIDSSISIKAHQDFKFNRTVTFNVESNAAYGYYDAEIFDTLLQKWHLQKEAVYVMNPNVQAVAISPNIVASENWGHTRLYTCWFKNTHFTQANEIRLGSYYHSPVVVNDTCIQFRGGNSDPLFYNEIDGYIGNNFIMNVVNSPAITLFSPNWVTNGSRAKFTLHSDASNWTYYKEMQFQFKKGFTEEENLKAIAYRVLNDTTLELEVEAGEDLAGTYDIWIKQFVPQTNSTETIVAWEVLKVVPVGINENLSGTKSQPIVVPNPNKGKFEIILKTNDFQFFEILDIHGKQIISGSLDQNKTPIDLSQEITQSGIYFIKLSGEKIMTLKFIFNP